MKQLFTQQLNAYSNVTVGHVVLVSLLVVIFFAGTFYWAKKQTKIA